MRRYSVWRELFDRPTSFQFFQAVRLLERYHPDRAPVGMDVDPAREAVRFATQTGLGFPASEIQSLEAGEEGSPDRLRVNFLGLTGPVGVLPYHYTLLAEDRARARDPAMVEFFDLFHHRMLSLFYRAWKRSRFVTGAEAGVDRLRTHLLDLAGVGMEELRNGLGLREELLAGYAGILSSTRRSAVALQQLLEDHFQVPVEVEQFVGGWYPLPEDDQCEVGEERGASTMLGLGAVVGDEVWDPQSRARIRVGPLSGSQYRRFLPGGEAFEELGRITRLYGNDEIEFELQLVLAKDEVRGCRLGAEGDDGEGEQPLGWFTWIRSAGFDRDADETILRL